MVKNRFLLVLLILFMAFPTMGKVNRYMVFFTDKNNNDYSLDHPEHFLSDRALDRRTNQSIRLKYNDLPVSSAYLNELQADNEVQVYFSTKWMNGALVEMDEVKMDEVLALPFINDVELVAHGSKLGESSSGGRTSKASKGELHKFDGSESQTQNEFIRVDEMHALGYHGENMLLAIFDSGFDHVDESSFFTHLMTNRLKATRDFIKGTDDVFQYDTHGSKVLSCISAYKDGVYSGTAPASDIVLCVTEDIGSEYRIEEYNWLFAAEYADSLGVDIINSSVGYSYFDDDRMDYIYNDLDGKTAVITKAASLAASKGMLIVCSNGNEGNNSWRYMNAPADADSILAVGAATYDLERANFSSIGPTSDGRIKPDISALGSWVKIVLGEEIIYANGTSFASPMLAGLASGLWQAYPKLSNMELIAYLKMSSSQSDAPDTLLGYGIANFTKAFNKIQLTENEIVDRLVVFPNPVTNKRFVYFYTDSLANNTIASIRFFDLKGSSLRTQELGATAPNELVEIDVSFLRPGSYILNYINGTVRKKSKLVVL